MLMGLIVRGERYGYRECCCAVMLAFGASLFLLSNNSKGPGSHGNVFETCSEKEKNQKFPKEIKKNNSKELRE